MALQLISLLQALQSGALCIIAYVVLNFWKSLDGGQEIFPQTKQKQKADNPQEVQKKHWAKVHADLSK